MPPLSMIAPARTKSGMVKRENFCTVACIMEGITPSGAPENIRVSALDTPRTMAMGMPNPIITAMEPNRIAADILVSLLC